MDSQNFFADLLIREELPIIIEKGLTTLFPERES